MMSCPACSKRVHNLFSGVCQGCKETFDARHRAVVVEGKSEVPSKAEELPSDPTVRHNFDETHHHENGHLCAVAMPEEDFAELDGIIAAQPPSVRQLAGELVREIFLFCFNTNHKKFGASELKTATLRFVVVAAGLRPDLLNNASNGQLARLLSRTKSTASKASCLFEDRFGLQFTRTRGKDARKRMRQARLAQGGANRNLGKRGKADTGGGQAPPSMKGFPDPIPKT